MKRHVGRLGVAWLLWRILGREPRPGTRIEQSHPWPQPGFTVFWNDAEYFIRDFGVASAPAVLLIHGWGDHSGVVWQRIAPRLAAHWRVVTIDHRNHGKSDARRGRYEIEDAADEIAGVMGELGLDRVHVIGYSMGGMIAQALAHRHPDRVDRLVLGGTSAGGASAPERAAAWIAFWIGRSLDRISRVEFSAVKWWYLRAVGVFDGEHGDWLWNEQMARDPELYWQAGFAALRFDSTEWVGGLPHPVMIFLPAQDQLVFPHLQRRLVGLVRDPVVLTLDGARHEAPLSHDGQIAAAVHGFLARTD